MVHLPGCTKATIEGPMLSFPCPKTLLVAVGKTNTGPAPQINLFGLVAKMKKVGVMSPNPNTPAFCCTFWAAQYAGVSSSMPNTSRFAVPGAGCEIIGAIQRIIRFQFSLTSIGTTGWMFNTFCVRSKGPIPKLLLFWTGTLMSLATGLWTAFCKLAAPSATSGVACDEDGCCAADGVSAQKKHQSNNTITVSFADLQLTVLRPSRLLKNSKIL